MNRQPPNGPASQLGTTSASRPNDQQPLRPGEPRFIARPAESFASEDAADLPPMMEAAIDEAELHSLVQQIAEQATQVTLMQSGRTAHQQADVVTLLEQASEKFLAGGLKRFQIRYHWQGKHWIDTISKRDAGIHLVRIAHRVES